MEALAQLLLTFGLALVVVALLALFRRRGGAPRRRRRRTIVVSDPAIVQLTLVEHADAFCNRPASLFPKADGFNGSYSISGAPHGPMWRALRCNLTSDILHPTRLHLLAALQRDAAEALVADLTPSGAGHAAAAVVVPRENLHASVFALTARLCFGDGGGERHRQVVRALEREVRQFATTFVHDTIFFAGATRMTKLRHWRRWLRWSGTLPRFHKLIHPVVAARRQSGDGGSIAIAGTTAIRCYVDSLLDLQVPAAAHSENNNGDDDNNSRRRRRRPLTDKDMARPVFEFLTANTESIVLCVEWTLAHLVINPEVQKKLHREITDDEAEAAAGMVVSDERLHRRLPYLRAVILESLRLHPPVPTIPRDVVSAKGAAMAAAGGPANVDGVPAVVITDTHKIGRSSKVWTDPDEFRPERFLPGGEAEGVGPVPGPKEIRMVPFGAGPRYCPGVDLSMVRIACILMALVRHFEWASPVEDGKSPDLQEFRAFFSMMKTPLMARITPRALLPTN